MHYLNRAHGPACLGKFQHGLHTWSQVTSADKAGIWEALNTMQGHRCAYCEADLAISVKHIEHFRQRSRHPQGTFVWSNLFGSCDRDESCGKHKDRCEAYLHDDLIKPDVDDPEQFFLFVSDGTIVVRHGLSPKDAHRARETLRILNLDSQHGPLRRMRQQAAAGYLQTSELLHALSVEFSPAECLPFLEEEIRATANLPFATAIKHVLMP